jgi:hypothetical protein
LNQNLYSMYKNNVKNYITRGFDKFLAPHNSRSRKTYSIVSRWKRDLFMCQIASLFWLQTLKRDMLGDVRDSTTSRRELVCILFCKLRRRKIIMAFWNQHYGTMPHCILPSNTVWHSLRIVIFPLLLRLNSQEWQPRGIIVQIHELILEYRRISAKSIAV